MAQEEVIYAATCEGRHGGKGAGQPNDRLVGSQSTINAAVPPVHNTIGSYWPYATTLFDYVRRAMPWNQPKSLTNDRFPIQPSQQHRSGRERRCIPR